MQETLKKTSDEELMKWFVSIEAELSKAPSDPKMLLIIAIKEELEDRGYEMVISKGETK